MTKRKEETSAKPEKSYTGEFIFGVLGGLLSGSILALWYAPRSGKETRQQIKEATIVPVQEAVGSVVDRVKGETVEDALNEGRALAHRHRASEAKLIQLGKDTSSEV